MDREGYREGATSEDDYSDLFGDQMDTHRQELTSQNLPVSKFLILGLKGVYSYRMEGWL